MRGIAKRDRKKFAGRFDERRISEGSGKVVTQRGRHDGQAQIAAAFLQIAEKGESEIGFEMTLVKLIEDNEAGFAQFAIGQQAACEDAFGEIPEFGFGTAHVFEANAIADGLAERFAHFIGHTAGGHARG